LGDYRSDLLSFGLDCSRDLHRCSHSRISCLDLDPVRSIRIRHLFLYRSPVMRSAWYFSPFGYDIRDIGVVLERIELFLSTGYLTAWFSDFLVVFGRSRCLGL
jgi:hypothetical protein